jgi:hypothetical protein
MPAGLGQRLLDVGGLVHDHVELVGVDADVFIGAL